MDIYLKNNNETFQFPVNPIDTLQIQMDKRFETVDIVDLGEFDIMQKGEKINEIGFKTLLPKEYDSFCRYMNLPNPLDTVKKIESWQQLETPLRLIITNFDFNDLVIISSFSKEKVSGENEDFYVDITFRRFRELKVETVQKASATTSKAPVTLNDNRKLPVTTNKTYIVQKNDTLWGIAKKVLGSGSKWPQIYNIAVNKKTIGNNPNVIKQGQKLVLP